MPSIEKRGKRSWRLIVEAGTKPDGTRDKQKKPIRVDDPALLKTTKKLKEYLEAEWWKFKEEVDAGTYIKPEKTTFKDFVDQHWRPKWAEKELGISTQTVYNQHLKTHILPRFGHMRLDSIKTMHVVDFVNYLTTPEARKDGKAGPLETATQRTIFRVCRSIFCRAVDWKFLKTNSMKGVPWPKKGDTEIIVYDEEEIEAIIDALYQQSDTWRLLILGTFLGGFRRGEMVALELDDLNFGDDTIRVDENIPMKIEGEFLIKGPKNKSSNRIVSMPHWYMEELAEYCREWRKRKLEIGDKWKGGDRQVVFHGGFGEPYHPNTPTAWWRKFLKKNQFRHVKLHGLRHTSATYLLEHGATIKSVQKRLGHADQRSTEIYLHVTQPVEKMTAQKFDHFDRRKNNRPQSVPKTG